MKKSSIKTKFVVGFFLIFLVSNIFLNIFIRNSINNNRNRSIQNQEEALLKTSRDYIKSVFESELQNVDENLLIKMSYNIVNKLSMLNNSYTAIYKTNGKLIEECNIGMPEEAIKNKEDVKYAINNKAYYLLNTYGEKTIILFSYPLYINDKFLGVISFRQDYTNNYEEYNNLIKTITIIQVITIFLTILFAAFLIGRLTKPLKVLTDKINDMKNGNYDGEIEIKSNDEIGILSKTFNEMQIEIKNYINNLKEEKEKVTKLEKAKQEFFNNVTHELKTPLTGISSYAQILEEGTDDKEFTKRAASRIKDESDRLHSLVLDLIEVSKGKTEIKEDKQYIELGNIITEVCSDLKKKADGAGVRFILNIVHIRMYGMQKKLQQLFINLIDNAIKYSVTDTDINIILYEEKDNIIFSIKNKSEIKTIDNADDLFNPYVKNNVNERGSRGLGLYICKNIVSMHDGEIGLICENYNVNVSVKFPK